MFRALALSARERVRTEDAVAARVVERAAALALGLPHPEVRAPPRVKVELTRMRRLTGKPVGGPESPLAPALELLELYGACRDRLRGIRDTYVRYSALVKRVEENPSARSPSLEREAVELLRDLRSRLLSFYRANCAPQPPHGGLGEAPRRVVRALDSLLAALEGGLDPLSPAARARIGAEVHRAARGFEELERALAAVGVLDALREARGGR